ncbi:MAG: hypothetical protein ACKVKG_08645, partial [Alphaproteobacteria bacterium]
GFLVCAPAGGVTPAIDLHFSAATLLAALQSRTGELFFAAALPANTANFAQARIANWSLIGRWAWFLTFRAA